MKEKMLTDAQAEAMMGLYVEAWQRRYAPDGMPFASGRTRTTLERKGLIRRATSNGWVITERGYEKVDEWQQHSQRTICPLPEELEPRPSPIRSTNDPPRQG